MKTSYILHGGKLLLEDQRNDSYFKRLTRDIQDGDVLLHIPFAEQSQEKQEIVFEREKKMIIENSNKPIVVVKANKTSIIEQIHEAKTIHICGGWSPALVDYIKTIPNFEKLISGKTVGGSSAGACLFSDKYWFGAENKTYNGLGILPIALFVHYGSKDFNATDDKLAKFIIESDGLELIKLEEAEWLEYTPRA